MKCKKLFALLLSLCMIASSFVTVSNADGLTTVTVGSTEGVKPGAEVVIPVTLSNNTAGICGLTLNFKYDPSVLTYVNVTQGDALTGLTLTKPGSGYTPGDITLPMDAMDADYTEGVILNITFKVADAANGGDHAINLKVETMCDFDFNDIENIAVSGKVNVDAPHEHAYTGEETTAATCKAEGVMTYTCSCGDSYTEAIPVTDHTYGDWTKKDGVNHKKVCSVCGDEKTAAHEWDDGVVTKEPTQTTEGTKKYSCICGESYTETIAKLPAVEIKDGNYLNFDLPLDKASELTWVASSAVTVKEVDGIGGRDNVLEVKGLANSNSNTAGVILGDNFKFEPGDVLEYSLDIYSNTAVTPDLWLRNHGAGNLEPFETLYHTALTAKKWTTITKTTTYEEWVASTENGAGSWTTAGKYALYVRPRASATLYLDNFKVAITREGYTGPVIEPEIPGESGGETPDPGPTPGEPTPPPSIDDEGMLTFINEICNLDEASELTWLGSDAVKVAEANGIGGRDKVLKVEGLADSNSNTAGISLPTEFEFRDGDIITYSIDVYAESAIKPDIWLRNHDGLDPYAALYKEAITAKKWQTITETLTFAELEEKKSTDCKFSFERTGNYALYLRPRNVTGAVYLDNLKLTVKGYERSQPVEVDSVIASDISVGSATFDVTFDGVIYAADILDGCYIDGKKEDKNIKYNVKKTGKQTASITVSGLLPSTEYKLILGGIVVPEETIAFKTLDEVIVDTENTSYNKESETFTYKITDNTTGDETIYAVLLRCKGNTVVESYYDSENKGEIKEVTALGDGEYFKFFVWTIENGSVNSLAPYVVIK